MQLALTLCASSAAKDDTDIPAIMGIFPPNVLPEEITSDREDRIRAVIVGGANPLRSYADTSAYEKAFKDLDLLVVLDVAMSETAAVADYVLSGRTAYESFDTTFWSFDFPDIFFHLRRPVVEPAVGTRENSWIMTALAEKMDLIPEIPNSLIQAAEKDRIQFGRDLREFMESTPEAKLKLPFILAKTLEPVLKSNNLAFLWGLLWSAPARFKAAMARAGFEEGDDQPDKAYAAILDHPEGIWLGRLDPENNLELVTFEDTNSEFGTIIAMLSKVLIVVKRIFIDITSPSISPTVTLSPTFIGLSNSRIKPEMKFDVTFCRPNPIPTDNNPKITANPARSTPTNWKAITIPAIIMK